VGATAAAILGDRGHKVDLYELRDDPRSEDAAPGRSINLALSDRGMRALRQIGMEEQCINAGVKMFARMIHNMDGSTYAVPYGRTEKHFILSISRLGLNQMILTEAEKRSNVNLHFEHRVSSVDLDGKLRFTNGLSAEGDILIGGDGAFSQVRRQMARGRFNFEQHYIPHGYKELLMDANADGSYKMEANYLHIWPRGKFMMIALPNLDGSFTCTLFMPFDIFDQIQTSEDGLNFMKREFPDSISIYGEEALKNQFGPGTLPGLPMISIKCSPHCVQNSIIVGDAAHAIVPFYGQGMNAGMEDVAVLMDLYDKNGRLTDAIKEYGTSRPKDAHAIADLALYNYIEMRDLVTSRWFLFRRTIDRFLASIAPSVVLPLYEMVVFNTGISYSTAVSRNKRQGKIIDSIIIGSAVVTLVAVVTNPSKALNGFHLGYNYLINFAQKTANSLLPTSILESFST